MKTKPTIIKDRINLNGLSKVYIRYTYNRKFVLIPTKDIYVYPKDFNYEKGYIKQSDSNSELKNNLIKKQCLNIEKIVLELRLKGFEPTLINVKNSLNNIEPIIQQSNIKEINLNNNIKIKENDLKLFELWEKHTKERFNIKEITPKTYRGIFNNIRILKDFERVKQYPLNFNSINKDFYNLLLDYCYNSIKLSDGSIDNIIKNLKYFMKFSFENGLHINNEYTQFRRTKKDSKIITLTYQEIIRLINIKIDKIWEQKHRDICILMLNSGLRFSDIQQLNQSHFTVSYLSGQRKYSYIHSYISLTTQKNKIPLKIPFNDGIFFIYEKYYKNGLDFKDISNKTFNDGLKKLCKKVKIDEPIETYIFRGKEKISKINPKWKIMSSHILRKSFISLSLTENNTDVVMSIVGSKDYRSFKRYIDMSIDSKRGVMDTVNQINGYIDELD